MFSPAVTDHWTPAGDLGRPELAVVVDDGLPANRAVMVLELAEGGGLVTLTPGHAETLGLADGSRTSPAAVLDALSRAGVAMNDPDHLFYLPLAEQAVVQAESLPPTTRLLGPADASAFAVFERSAPAADLDEAFVELDHWAVLGSFDDERLVCAASAYPWQGTHLADLGVLTLPGDRGRGLGRRTVRALSAEALARGHQPQYRCQQDNTASIALAGAAGFRRYGRWHVISGDD
ncbi:GNAT family N-acetyltransferase [Microlunatus capsulatus]|uniref:GNAT superfamily N-acetyltransferase n=1 Tax=Microlunatus capsulatus TaxID=99117 RepID=A0ABS4Z2X4_9ACTN|nr:GNAT family N-acetyltransferase [Microlunatus capsulatus]MBP2415341.1 GNAT superfamily N-acetyltransferase [Microlunatus capsulatus]